MSFGKTSPGALAAMATRIMEYPVTNDEDIAELAKLMRDFAQACGHVVNTGGDTIYSALFFYDRQKKRLGKTRAERVVKPIRHFAHEMLDHPHRYMFRAVQIYNKEYAEDILTAHASKKPAFKPGPAGKAA